MNRILSIFLITASFHLHAAPETPDPFQNLQARLEDIEKGLQDISENSLRGRANPRMNALRLSVSRCKITNVTITKRLEYFRKMLIKFYVANQVFFREIDSEFNVPILVKIQKDIQDIKAGVGIENEGASTNLELELNE